WPCSRGDRHAEAGRSCEGVPAEGDRVLRWAWGPSLNFERGAASMSATVGAAMQSAVGRLHAAGIDTARLDARLLLGDVLNLPTADLVAHPERLLAAPESERFP